MKRVRKTAHHPRLDSSAFTLLEVLISLALIAVFVTGIASFSSYKNRATEASRTVASRDKILESITTYLRMDSSIRNSLNVSDNPELWNCVSPTIVFEDDPSVPPKCISNQTYPMILYGPTASFGGVITGAKTGTPNNPVLYDSWGTACDPSTNPKLNDNCVIEVSTVFRPQCSPATFGGPPRARCDVAETIEIEYTIKRKDSASSANFDAFRKQITGRISSDVAAVTGNTPNERPIVIPMPSPEPSPTGPAPSPQPEPTSTPTGTPETPKPMICPGDTIPDGPNRCACRKGYVLINSKGRCKWIGI